MSEKHFCQGCVSRIENSHPLMTLYADGLVNEITAKNASNPLKHRRYFREEVYKARAQLVSDEFEKTHPGKPWPLEKVQMHMRYHISVYSHPDLLIEESEDGRERLFDASLKDPRGFYVYVNKQRELKRIQDHARVQQSTTQKNET